MKLASGPKRSQLRAPHIHFERQIAGEASEERAIRRGWADLDPLQATLPPLISLLSLCSSLRGADDLICSQQVAQPPVMAGERVRERKGAARWKEMSSNFELERKRPQSLFRTAPFSFLFFGRRPAECEGMARLISSPLDQTDRPTSSHKRNVIAMESHSQYHAPTHPPSREAKMKSRQKAIYLISREVRVETGFFI